MFLSLFCVAIAGVGALIKAASEFVPAESRRRKWMGIAGLYLALLGLFATFISTIVQQRNAIRASEDAATRAADQIAALNTLTASQHQTLLTIETEIYRIRRLQLHTSIRIDAKSAGYEPDFEWIKEAQRVASDRDGGPNSPADHRAVLPGVYPRDFIAFPGKPRSVRAWSIESTSPYMPVNESKESILRSFLEQLTLRLELEKADPLNKDLSNVIGRGIRHEKNPPSLSCVLNRDDWDLYIDTRTGELTLTGWFEANEREIARNGITSLNQLVGGVATVFLTFKEPDRIHPAHQKIAQTIFKNTQVSKVIRIIVNGFFLDLQDYEQTKVKSNDGDGFLIFRFPSAITDVAK